MPKIVDDGKMAVALYGKSTTEGDTALLVGSNGALVMTPHAEALTLKASSEVIAAVVNATGTPVATTSRWKRVIVLLDLSESAATEAGDTLDVFVDVSLDGSTWLNAIHFTQIVGTDTAKKLFAVLDPSAPGTSVIDASSDAAAGAVRPALFGPQMRARWTVVDADDPDDCSFTFSVTAYGQA